MQQYLKMSRGAALSSVVCVFILLLVALTAVPASALSCAGLAPSPPTTLSTAQGSAFATCGAQTSPLIVDTFFGRARTDDGTNENPIGRQSFAYEAWDADIGEPVRQVYFDSPITGSSISLNQFVAQDQGLVTTSLGTFFAFKTGGDIGIYPLFRDPDNLVVKQSGTPYKGVANVDDLTQPNLNVLEPGGNRFIDIMFGEGLNLQSGTIANFGRTEAFGAFVSGATTRTTLSIYDGVDSLIFEFSQTPPSMDQYFMGIALQRRDQPKQEIIARARFTFEGTNSVAIDGVVSTTIVGGAAPQMVPEPSSLLLLVAGVAALAASALKTAGRAPRTRPGS